jgi:hypothetical protein
MNRARSYRQLVQNDSNLDRLLVPRQLVKLLDRLVKRSSRLDDAIVIGRVIRIERDAGGQTRVPRLDERLGEIQPGEPSTIGEHMDLCFRHPRS